MLRSTTIRSSRHHPRRASQVDPRQVMRGLAEFGNNPVTESTDFRPCLVAAPADEVIAVAANREFGAERHDEAPGLQIVERDSLMAEHDARTFHGRVDCMIRGIETQAARWIHIVYADDAEPIRPTRWSRERRRRPDVNECMPCKVSGA